MLPLLVGRQSQRTEPVRIGQIFPLRGFARDALRPHPVAVVAHAERADRRAVIGRRPPRVAAESGGNQLLAGWGRDQAGRHLIRRPRRHQQALARGVVAVERAAAEHQIDLAGKLRGIVGAAKGPEQFALRRPVGLGHAVGLAVGIERAAQDDRRPVGPPRLPLPLSPRPEARNVFAGEVAHDFGRAADVAPIHLDRLPVAPRMPARKRQAEFVADGLVVRRDDHQDGIARPPFLHADVLPERERQRENRGQHEQDGDIANHFRQDNRIYRINRMAYQFSRDGDGLRYIRCFRLNASFGSPKLKSSPTFSPVAVK